MSEIKYIIKKLGTYPQTEPHLKNVEFQKPQICPHCTISTDASYVSSSVYTDVEYKLRIFVWKCTACKRLFLSFYSTNDTNCSFLGLFPSNCLTYYDKQLEDVSPRFIELYNQALRSESHGDYNLAAVGMRNALEILIKDYAITCLNTPIEDVIKLDLFKSISTYLPSDDIIKTADVIRILGNDHTHYERKYPEYDYQLLKSYMDIFISQIKTKILIQNPPVSRG